MHSFLRRGRWIDLAAVLVALFMLAACNAKEPPPAQAAAAPTPAAAPAGPYEAGVAAYERRDYKGAAGLWRPAAESGDRQSQYQLAWLYLDARGVPKDEAAAAKYFRLAAEQSSAAAQCALGSLYLQGRGVPQSYDEAWKWMRRSAEQDFPLAQYYLGWLNQYGVGSSPRDIAAAEKWYRLSANQRESRAQLALGRMYQSGNGLPRDEVLAHAWYSLAMTSDPRAKPETLRVARQWRGELAARMMTADIKRAETLAAAWRPGAI